MDIITASGERLDRQLDFIIELDKIKNIIRKTKLFNGSRYENDAEHSWTICMMALLLKEYANFPVNIEKVMVMLMIHDIVEIDAGDAFLYSPERDKVKPAEEKAAQRIFGLLEEDQHLYFMGLWNEFEERKTNEAKFASVFDRLEPLLQNYLTEGHSWKEHNITYGMVVEKNRHMEQGSKEIWQFVLKLLEKAKEKGYLAE